MKIIYKAILIACMLALMPFKNWAQHQFGQSQPTIEFDITSLSLYNERVFFIHSLLNDSRFDVVPGEKDGFFIISASESFESFDLTQEFRDFQYENSLQYAAMDKQQAAETALSLKSQLPEEVVLSLMMDVYAKSRQNNTCANADPFCTDNGMYEFPAGVNAGNGETGPSYSCLYSTPNPAWYYMRIANPGNMDIYMYSTPSEDIDFCCWGPFDDPVTPCPNGLTSNKVVSCSYSAYAEEDCLIPASAQTGDYFILVITNYSNDPCNIHFSKISGTGTTDCSILPPLVDNDGPYCVGETINLTANGQTGASYSWTGPNFTSNQQNPSRPNCTMDMSGAYTCTIAVGSQTNSATTDIVVYAQPTASFIATTVCEGDPTEFTSISTTNPYGQTITEFHWDFGDGTSSTEQNPSHTYAQAGSYPVELYVSTGNGRCSSQVTQTVIVEASPTASFEATTVCQGEPMEFTSTSTGENIDSYDWTFDDEQQATGQHVFHTFAHAGTHQVTLSVKNSSNCTDVITQTVTVNPTPTSSFTATSVCEGEPTVLSSTSTGEGITSYQWTFDDGQQATGQTISHTFAQAGTYQVTLFVESSSGCSDQITQTVTVNAVPTADFNANTVCENEATQFTCTSASSIITSYQWDFGDNQTGTGQNTSHTYAQAGDYQATLNVLTANGCSDHITQTVTVNPTPTASFNATTVCQGEATQFTSTATGSDISNHQWTFDDGQTSTGQNVNHTFAQAGLHQVTLTVHSQEGCSDNITQTVEVYAMPSAQATATPSTVNYGGFATLTGNAGAQGVFDFHWEPANMVLNPNSQTTQTVALQQSQTYTLTVTNPQGGCTSTSQITVSLNGTGLTAMASADHTDLCEGESTLLHALPSGGDTEHYSFSWTPANTLNDPTSQNPVATPATGTTTYTCLISDGFTNVNVNVTLQVHPIEEQHLYETICANSTYDFYGTNVSTPNTYEHHEQTQYGCDKTVYLHLDNWPIYDETTVTQYICQGESFTFYGNEYSEAGVYEHTDQTQLHGCDSIVRLNLILNPVYEFEIWETTCEGGPGYLFDGQYLQPSSTAYEFSYETHAHCDSIIYLHIDEAEYNTKNYNVTLCASEFTWGSNGVTYYQSGTYYDTLKYENTCDSTLVLNLQLNQGTHNDYVVASCDSYRWRNDDIGVDKTFDESTVYTHHYLNEFGCESEATLHLTISDTQESSFTVAEEESCDEYFWDPEGHEIVASNFDGLVYSQSGAYQRTYKDQADCDSIVTMYVDFEYTPRPTPIYPVDNNNTAPHWVVTATEFQINTYEFNLWDSLHPAAIHWDSVIWKFEDPSVQWILEPNENTTPPGMECKIYVLNHIADTIWLEARVYNRCAIDGIPSRYWFVSSFYGMNDHTAQEANLTIVPNPNKGQMTLNFEHFNGDINIKVYDMRGSLIDQFETYGSLPSNAYNYQMRSREPGIYFIVATNKEGTIAKKVVIQR